MRSCSCTPGSHTRTPRALAKKSMGLRKNFSTRANSNLSRNLSTNLINDIVVNFEEQNKP